MAYPQDPNYNPAQMSYAGGAPAAPGGYGGFPGGPGGPAPGYPGYGGPPVDPEVQHWFDAVDVDRSGRITAKELQGALVNGQGRNFNIQVCELMLGMFDKSNSGTIDVQGFQQLYRYMNQWLDTFRGLDKDQSGQIEQPELTQAFEQMGYRFSPGFIQNLLHKADKEQHRCITVDQFILSCIQIQRFTDAFRSRDTEMKGVITIGFEDFLALALSSS